MLVPPPSTPPFYVCLQTASTLWAIPPGDLAKENHLRVFLSDNTPAEGELSASFSTSPPEGSVVLDSQLPDEVTDDQLSTLNELMETGLVFSTRWSCCGFIVSP